MKPKASFGVLVHPYDLDDVAERFAIAGKMPPAVTAEIVRHWPPFVASKITGVVSKATGQEITGVLGVVPLLPEQFAELPDEAVVEKVIRACKACARQRARIIGLGGLMALAGRGGRAVAEYMRVAVTTGNTYTIATAIQATRVAAAEMEIDMPGSTLAVLGATGPVGRACSILLAPEFGRVLLVGRDRMKLSALKPEVKGSRGVDVDVRTDVISAAREADVIVVASAAVARLVRPSEIRPGAVVVDVIRPRDFSRSVNEARPDVLAIAGGVVCVPGAIDFGADSGLAPGIAFASMAEPMILALEGRFEDYTLGKEVSVERILEVGELATKHGFELAGLRVGDRLLAPAGVEAIRGAAGD